MSAQGVQTLYLQGAAQTGDPGVLESGRLLALIGRAHQRGLRVVVWYMPGLTDLAADYSRLVALGHLPVDGVAVDIESRDDPDIADRNAGLVTLSEAVRQALPDVALGAIVLPPSLLEVVNPAFWPDFPVAGDRPVLRRLAAHDVLDRPAAGVGIPGRVHLHRRQRRAAAP